MNQLVPSTKTPRTLLLFALACALLAPQMASADTARNGQRYDLRGSAPRVGHTQTIVTRRTMESRTDVTAAGRRMRGRVRLKANDHVAITVAALDGEDLVEGTEVTVAGHQRGTVTIGGSKRSIDEADETVGIRLRSRKTATGWSNELLDPAPLEVQKVLGDLQLADWRELLPTQPVAIGESWRLDDSLLTRNFSQALRNAGVPSDANTELVATLRAVKSRGKTRVAHIALRQTMTLHTTVSRDGKDVQIELSMSGTGTMRVDLRDHSYRTTMKVDGGLSMSVTSQYGTEFMHIKIRGPIKVEMDCHPETADERAARTSLRSDNAARSDQPRLGGRTAEAGVIGVGANAPRGDRRLLEHNANVVDDILAEDGD